MLASGRVWIWERHVALEDQRLSPGDCNLGSSKGMWQPVTYYPCSRFLFRVVAPQLHGEHKLFAEIVEYTGWYMIGDSMFILRTLECNTMTESQSTSDWKGVL